MARRILPLLSQKQIDQAIKNFIVEPNPKSTKVRLCLNGGTAISFEIYKDYVRAYRAKKSTWVFLGYYYSEDLETDPEINYQMPPAPFYTYDEILKRGEEVRIHGVPLGDNDFSQVTNVNVTRQAPRIGRPKVKRPLLEPAPSTQVKAAALKPESVGVSEKKETVSASPKTNENDDLKESLKRRLRLLDLKIEREEILNKLAAIENYERIS